MRYILNGLVFILLISCSALNKKQQTQHECTKFNCLESFLNQENTDKVGKIKLRIDIDSVQLGSENTAIKKLIKITIDKESELIVFGDTLGIKLFHVEATTYNTIKHFVKYDFFIKEKDCWIRKVEFGFSELNYFTTTNGYGSFATGTAGEDHYIKVVWSLTRLK